MPGPPSHLLSFPPGSVLSFLELSLPPRPKVVVLGRWTAWGPSRPPESNGERVSVDPGSLEGGLAESTSA